MLEAYVTRPVALYSQLKLWQLVTAVVQQLHIQRVRVWCGEGPYDCKQLTLCTMRSLNIKII